VKSSRTERRNEKTKYCLLTLLTLPLELDSARLASLPGRKMSLRRIIDALPTRPVSGSQLTISPSILALHAFPPPLPHRGDGGSLSYIFKGPNS
jgi:hypothetical protein